jgi:lysophospholipase L1-like esterase
MFRQFLPRIAVTSVVASATLIAGAAAASAVATPQAARARVTSHRSVVVRPNDAKLAYLGHWAVSANGATTVNPGSRLSFTFTGTQAIATFTLAPNPLRPELYVTVDGHSRVVPVNAAVIPLATKLRKKTHTVQIDVKSMDAYGTGWTPPLAAAITLRSLDLGQGAKLGIPPKAAKLRFEFYGDSVSEGIMALSPVYSIAGGDATKSFSALVSKAYRADGAVIGFAGQGITVAGIGKVPTAPQTFGSIYSGVPAKSSEADAIVLHFGLNDSAADASTFTTAYAGYLKQIRAAKPRAFIFAVEPFNGTHAADIAAAVTQVGDDKIVAVDTTGWLSAGGAPDGLHPNAGGQRTLAAHLVTTISDKTGWKPIYLHP